MWFVNRSAKQGSIPPASPHGICGLTEQFLPMLAPVIAKILGEPLGVPFFGKPC